MGYGGCLGFGRDVEIGDGDGEVGELEMEYFWLKIGEGLVKY